MLILIKFDVFDDHKSISTISHQFSQKFEVDQQWCQDPFYDATKGIIEPLTCPMVEGLSARYCRKVVQEGEFKTPSNFVLMIV